MADRTPLYEPMTKAGAVFAEKDGWLMPVYFGDTAAEYAAAAHGALLFDISHHGKLELTGKDAATFLHNLSTNEVKSLSPGSGCEAFLTTGQAKIVAYVLIYRNPPGEPGCVSTGSTFCLDTGPVMAEKVFKHLDRFLISEQVEIVDRTSEFAQLHLAGPQAEETLGRLLQIPLPELNELSHCLSSLASSPVVIRRHHPLGMPGYDILCSSNQAEQVWRALVNGGARPAGLEAYETLRIEAGTPVYGIDIDESNLPQEVGRIDRTVSFTKGCYIGQETVARIRTYGHVNRALVGLKLSQPNAAEHGAKLLRDGKEVGIVTSSVYSPRLGTAIALAYVRRGNEQPGIIVETAGGGTSMAGEIVSLPFVGPCSSTG
jgi:glycine cleavage system T protein